VVVETVNYTGYCLIYKCYKVSIMCQSIYTVSIPQAFEPGTAGVLKRTTNEQRQMGPRHGWIKIGVGIITDQIRNISVAIN
jgi:hypothetical protein